MRSKWRAKEHIKRVQDQSYTWKIKYKTETGAMRGRIEALESLVYHLRSCRWCGDMDVISCHKGGKELWEAAGMPADPQ